MSTLRFKNGLWVPPDTYKDPFKRPTTGYRVPIVVLNELGLTAEEAELVQAMNEHAPETQFRDGDLVYLKRCPPRLRMQREMIPRFWKVRWVISTWAYEVHALVHNPELAGNISGIDHIVALMEAQPSYEERRNKRSMIYAHAFPHGLYPDTAMWFTESCFRKATLTEICQTWPQVLDEAKAPFYGYDRDALLANFALDMAPDYYRDGEAIGRPFDSEEATFHTAALLGMEELMMTPVDPWAIGDPHDLDPEHDIFVKAD